MSKFDKKESVNELDFSKFTGVLNTQTDVESIIEDIEGKYGVEVLFSSLIGSRVYGYNHKNSDYNIRFVYKKPMEEYLKVCRVKDTIKVRQHLYEVTGWDVKKMLHQHYLSNPVIYEWVSSPVRYTVDGIGFDELMPFDHNILSKWFYLIAQHNFNKAHRELPYKLKYMDVKGYLYAIRYILMWNILTNQKKSPPITLDELLMGNENIPFIDYIYLFIEYYRSQGVGEIGYIELSNLNSWIRNSLVIMGNTYPLRPPMRKDCYYYNKRFLDLVTQSL